MVRDSQSQIGAPLLPESSQSQRVVKAVRSLGSGDTEALT